jgi:hypothetical protein
MNLLTLSTEDFNALDKAHRLIALDRAQDLGKYAATVSLLLELPTFGEGPEYKHFVLDVLAEHGYQPLALHFASVNELEKDPRVQIFKQAWNRRINESLNPF